MFSRFLSQTYSIAAHYAGRVESYFKLAALMLLIGSLFVACGNKNAGNGAVGGVNILSVNNGGVATTGFGGTTTLTVSVADSAGGPAQAYVLNVAPGIINGDLRQFGQNVYELQTACANVNCSDVAFLIVARRGFANSTGTFNNYLGTNPLANDGVSYLPTASTGYVLTTQPFGSVEFLYRATGTTGAPGTSPIVWQLVKTLTDSTGQITVLNPTQLQALEAP